MSVKLVSTPTHCSDISESSKIGGKMIRAAVASGGESDEDIDYEAEAEAARMRQQSDQ